MKLPQIPFVVLDTETTGFIPRVNHVIEFASVRVEEGKIVDEYEKLISIPTAIPETVQTLTRIRGSDIEGKPRFEELREEILSHIGEDAVIIGQNIGFDIRMLKGEGIDLSNRKWIDTSMLASVVFPELASYSLGYMSAVLGLNHEPVHRALGDVHATLELLERCWARFEELPDELIDILQVIMKKSSPSYQLLFGSLEKSGKKKVPAWLKMPDPTPQKTKSTPPEILESVLKKPTAGQVSLVEEPLQPSLIFDLIAEATRSKETTHWIAVKNLDAVLRRIEIPKGVRVLYPPFKLLDIHAAENFAALNAYTSDEASLAVKLAFYEGVREDTLPIHGEERAIWNSKLACTYESEAYRNQFTDLPSVVLLDHRQLLSLLADQDHVGRKSLNADSHIIITDASMLEDTATRAYSWYCALDDIRAGSQGNAVLTRAGDLLQIWIEKTRNAQDIHFIRPSDTATEDARGLLERIAEALQENMAAPLKKQLEDLQKILSSHDQTRLTWIEQRQNGSQFITSAPERIAEVLDTLLYQNFSTTLLIPPGSSSSLTEFLPAKREITFAEIPEDTKKVIPLIIDTEKNIGEILENPPEGKTVVLIASRKTIEDFFIKYTELLEKKNVTLICQNLSGGQGRMQAEFTTAKSPCLWLITPWTYETVELAPNIIDHLVLQSIPFDHPAHPVFSKRADHFKNGFEEYSLPRLQHRLFRLLRTFSMHKNSSADVLCIDDRLKTKSYGRKVIDFLSQFTFAPSENAPVAEKSDEKEEKPKKKSTKKADGKSKDQLTLF